MERAVTHVLSPLDSSGGCHRLRRLWCAIAARCCFHDVIDEALPHSANRTRREISRSAAYHGETGSGSRHLLIIAMGISRSTAAMVLAAQTDPGEDEDRLFMSCASPLSGHGRTLRSLADDILAQGAARAALCRHYGVQLQRREFNMWMRCLRVPQLEMASRRAAAPCHMALLPALSTTAEGGSCQNHHHLSCSRGAEEAMRFISLSGRIAHMQKAGTGPEA